MKIYKAARIERDGYVPIDDLISQQTSTGDHIVALYAELENDDEDTQYPLEDLLEAYDAYAPVVDETSTDGKRLLYMEIASMDAENIQAIARLVGKRVYDGEDERGLYQLIIE